MRQCPTCRRQYTNDLTFCLEDGSTLVELPNDDRDVDTQFAKVPGTVAFPGPHGPAQRKRSGLLILIAVGLFLAGGLVLAAAAVGGYIYLTRQENVNIPPPTRTTPSPTPEYGSPTPVSRRTPTPSPTRSPNRIDDSTPDDDLTTIGSSKDEREKRRPVPKQISGGVLNGKAISLPKPAYPPAARAVRASGAVSVQVLVNEEGNVVSASAVSGHPLLRAAAVQAARSARFSPTMLAGQPVKVSGVLTYNFVP